jgi:hypothetical protein
VLVNAYLESSADRFPGKTAIVCANARWTYAQIRDRSRRLAAIGPPMMPTGDYASDLKRIADFYRNAWPDNPRFQEIDRGVGGLSKPPVDRLGEPA